MIEVLVGMIASGKSTWCKQRAQDGWIIMNDDAIVNGLHANDYTLYRKSLKPLYKSIEDHILHTAIAMGKNIVIDRGLDVSTKSRARWICLGRSLDVPVRAVVFEVFPPEVHGMRRFESDPRGHTLEYWVDVATAHWARYNAPTTEEGFVDLEFKAWNK